MVKFKADGFAYKYTNRMPPANPLNSEPGWVANANVPEDRVYGVDLESIGYWPEGGALPARSAASTMNWGTNKLSTSSIGVTHGVTHSWLKDFRSHAKLLAGELIPEHEKGCGECEKARELRKRAILNDKSPGKEILQVGVEDLSGWLRVLDLMNRDTPATSEVS